MAPRFTLAPLESMTGYGPLVALGFFVRQRDLWAPIRQRVRFDGPTHVDEPVEALFDLWVGLLAGCEVVSQVHKNTTGVMDLWCCRCLRATISNSLLWNFFRRCE